MLEVMANQSRRPALGGRLVGLVGLASVMLVSLAVAGCAGTSKPAPSGASSAGSPRRSVVTSGAGPLRRTAVVSCEQRAGRANPPGISLTNSGERLSLHDLGAPAIISAKGSDVEVLFVDRRQNYVRDCVFAPDGFDLIAGEALSSFPAVHDPNGIDNDADVDLTADCGHASGEPKTAFGEEFGRVGTNVTAVWFEFAHEAPLQGTVRHGFYEAWWNWREYPDRVTFRTLSGNVFNRKIVDYSPATKSC